MISPSQRPLPDNTQHSQQTSMPRVGFEPTISAGERPKTYVLDRAATGTGTAQPIGSRFVSLYVKLLLVLPSRSWSSPWGWYLCQIVSGDLSNSSVVIGCSVGTTLLSPFTLLLTLTFLQWSRTGRPNPNLNLLKPNDVYTCRTAALTSRRYILNIYSTSIHTEYFKHAA